MNNIKNESLDNFHEETRKINIALSDKKGLRYTKTEWGKFFGKRDILYYVHLPNLLIEKGVLVNEGIEIGYNNRRTNLYVFSGNPLYWLFYKEFREEVNQHYKEKINKPEVKNEIKHRPVSISLPKFYEPEVKNEIKHRPVSISIPKFYEPKYQKCNACNEIKEISEFPKDRNRKTGHATICKKCKLIKCRIYRNKLKNINMEKPELKFDLNMNFDEKKSDLKSFSDAELVSELRQRGFEVSAKKVTVIEL